MEIFLIILIISLTTFTQICIELVLMWAQPTKIYPPLPTSVQPISIIKTLPIVPTKNERDPTLFTGKLLIKFQNILRNTTQVIIRHRVKILFSVISSPINLERQKWKSSKMKGILLSSPVNTWSNLKRFWETQLKLSYDIGFVYRWMDEHGETSIPPYKFVAGSIIMCA
jgi:hypothetical protein